MPYEPRLIGQSVVYFVQAGEGGPVKIGTTKDIKTRLIDIQIGCWVEIRLLAELPGNATSEAAFHRRFEEHWIRGEWFRPHEELMRCIEHIRKFRALPQEDMGTNGTIRKSPRGKPCYELKHLEETCLQSPSSPLVDGSLAEPSQDASVSIAEPSIDGVKTA